MKGCRLRLGCKPQCEEALKSRMALYTESHSVQHLYFSGVVASWHNDCSEAGVEVATSPASKKVGGQYGSKVEVGWGECDTRKAMMDLGWDCRESLIPFFRVDR